MDTTHQVRTKTHLSAPWTESPDRKTYRLSYTNANIFLQHDDARPQHTSRLCRRTSLRQRKLRRISKDSGRWFPAKWKQVQRSNKQNHFRSQQVNPSVFFLFRCAPRISRTRSICPSTHRTVRPPARLSVRPSDRPLLRTQKEDKPAYKRIDFKPLNYLTP